METATDALPRNDTPSGEPLRVDAGQIARSRGPRFAGHAASSSQFSVWEGAVNLRLVAEWVCRARRNDRVRRETTEITPFTQVTRRIGFPVGRQGLCAESESLANRDVTTRR